MPNKRIYVKIAEQALGHELPDGAVVHHIDENRENNSNDNLVILQNENEHRALHRRLRVLQAGGDPWTQQLCCTCHEVKDFDQFPAHTPYSAARYNTPRRGECRACKSVRDMLAHASRVGRPPRYETPEERSERARHAAQSRWGG